MVLILGGPVVSKELICPPPTLNAPDGVEPGGGGEAAPLGQADALSMADHRPHHWADPGAMFGALRDAAVRKDNNNNISSCLLI